MRKATQVLDEQDGSSGRVANRAVIIAGTKVFKDLIPEANALLVWKTGRTQDIPHEISDWHDISESVRFLVALQNVWGMDGPYAPLSRMVTSMISGEVCR